MELSDYGPYYPSPPNRAGLTARGQCHALAGWGPGPGHGCQTVIDASTHPSAQLGSAVCLSDGSLYLSLSAHYVDRRHSVLNDIAAAHSRPALSTVQQCVLLAPSPPLLLISCCVPCRHCLVSWLTPYTTPCFKLITLCILQLQVHTVNGLWV